MLNDALYSPLYFLYSSGSQRSFVDVELSLTMKIFLRSVHTHQMINREISYQVNRHSPFSEFQTVGIFRLDLSLTENAVFTDNGTK